MIMDYTMQQRIELIMRECLSSDETDPIKLFYKIACMDFVRIHGPEHHFLDGACILVAYRNAVGNVERRPLLDSRAQHEDARGYVRTLGRVRCGHVYWGCAVCHRRNGSFVSGGLGQAYALYLRGFGSSLKYGWSAML